MKKQSLVADFRMTVTRIAIASIVATLITWGIVAILYLLVQNSGIYPANYYEKQIPAIEQHIREENTQLLSKENEESLKNFIKGDNFYYQVVDSNALPLYGNSADSIFSSKIDLMNHLNTTTVYKNKNSYLNVTPLIDENGEIEGAVAIIYQVKLSTVNNGGKWILVALVGAMLSPVLYIILFTMFFSKQFVKRINKPLQLLREAAEKIKNKDLDFEVNYYSENELGQLCTAFSEMQEELKDSLSAQWKMEQERIDMVEALAHDLKTPVSIVLSYTESLLNSKRDNPERVQRYLSVIEESAVRCSNLVQQMKIASKSERFEEGLELTATNLYSFLSQKVNSYELRAKENGITIELGDDNSLHALYLLDIDKLNRIFDNIISNSLRYTPMSGKISIFALVDNEKITYQVCDTGCGFNQKDLKYATERFYRADEARQGGDEGHSGLGLYTVKQLISQIGGKIKLSNNESGGACIEFSQKNFNKQEL